LPTVVERIIHSTSAEEPSSPFVQNMADTFPIADVNELRDTLTPLFEHAFRLIDDRPEVFANL
jgi:hypothetical protein